MATYYWVGSSGNWSDATNHWSNASGGSPNASYLPTSADSVIFDANSNTGTGAFTVTVDGTSGSPSLCADFSTGGAGGALDGAMTLAFGTTGYLDVYGSFTLPATNFSVSATSGNIRWQATSTGKTITTNGVTLTNISSEFLGVGGGWTLGSAYTQTGYGITLTNGTFDTGNYALTVNSLSSSGTTNTRSFVFGSSSITLAGSAPLGLASAGLTFNAGTSTITCSAASPTFAGGGLTFYNVTFSSTATGTTTITGANTFNNLTQTSRNATGQRIVEIGANQTISGTLTLGASNTAIRRIQINSSLVGTQRTITLNGTLATLADVDFRDIVTAGSAGTWTGTRIGNGLNNSGITFDTPKTVYWNLAATQNWSATGWATTNNGSPAVNNFPLAQDTATFTEAGAAGTVTYDAQWWVGNIQMADGVSNRTTAFTLATSTTNPRIYGNVTLFSNLTLTGTGNLQFFGQGVTQTVTSTGISFPQAITVNAPTGTFKIADNFTQTSATGFAHTAGTVDLNNLTLTCYLWSSSNSNTRAITFGTGQITLTGNGVTVWTTATTTNFSYTGTSNVVSNYSGSTGTRTFSMGSLTESQAISVSITAGTDTITNTTSNFKNLIFSGFSGTLTGAAKGIYGNLTFSAGMTLGATASSTQFFATSGTQQITTNGVTIDFPLTFNGVGGTMAFQDALTQGSTRAFTIINGTVQFKASTTNVVGAFATSGTNQKFLQSTSAGTQATISQASGTVTANYLTIKDSKATGGATFNAFTGAGGDSSANNVNAGNNTGWNFIPAGSSFLAFF